MTQRAHLLRLGLAIMPAALSLVTAVHAVELDPKVVASVTPDQFKWRDPTMAAATNQTILYGDPNKTGGIYIYINKFKPNRFGNAHSHPNEQWIYVLEGELEMEFDGKWYRGGPGHCFYVPANKVHKARNEGARDCVFFTCKDASHGLHGKKA